MSDADEWIGCHICVSSITIINLNVLPPLLCRFGLGFHYDDIILS